MYFLPWQFFSAETLLSTCIELPSAIVVTMVFYWVISVSRAFAGGWPEAALFQLWASCLKTGSRFLQLRCTEYRRALLVADLRQFGFSRKCPNVCGSCKDHIQLFACNVDAICHCQVSIVQSLQIDRVIR